MTVRIGHGFDAHRFGPGDHVTLGGVRIAHARGVVAHSDGDVLIHALCDALLGAAALGDIGRHFPDSDPRYRGADSRDLLRQVIGMLHERGYAVVNADLTLVAQAPRVAAHIGAMRKVLSGDLQVGEDAVNIKATTTEQMGWIGRGEGLAAHAVVLIRKPSAA
ncbi:MAG TPA: 2-C-methyl-D-erythritol 2,4-cyclodiphosphate synthase [Nevskiales bacterium]|nr:2-C-methyl-D-erythritol 2,4-cyclodiphosphate synthase [Nevskiales bacterium]